MMEQKESAIEGSFGADFTNWCIAEGINAAYVKIQGVRGWPDRLIPFGTPDNPHMIWIEWKRPGEKPRPMQKHIHKELQKMGHEVRVYDDRRIALQEIKAFVLSKIRTDESDEACRVYGGI